MAIVSKASSHKEVELNEPETVEKALEKESKVVETLDDPSKEVEASTVASPENTSEDKSEVETLEKTTLVDESVETLKDESKEDEASTNVKGADTDVKGADTDVEAENPENHQVENPEAENPENHQVENPEAENHPAESIMEPLFTVLKGSKKRKQNRRLDSGLPMKKKQHLCCSTCVGDRTYSPLCYVLEDKQERCLCQQAKGIIEDELGIVGDKKLVYMERIRATPHGNETVTYEDVAFTGEVQRCTVCLTDIGHRYLGTHGRDDGREMVRSDITGEMMLMGGPMQHYFLLDRKKLKIVEVTFKQSKAAE